MKAAIIIFVNLVFLLLMIRQIIKVILAFWTDLTTDVPFHQTKYQVINQVLKITEASHAKSFFELGAGDGRLSIAIAAKLPLVEVTAVELNPFLVWLGKLKTYFKQLSSRVTWIKQNLFEIDLSQADIIYLYLLTEVNQRLLPKLETEVKTGAKVISWKFDLNSDQFRLIKEWGKQDKLRVFEKI
jgi:predicted RNA methylase